MSSLSVRANGDSGAPALWADEFAGDAFSASEFVAARLRAVPLPRLRGDLGAALADLKARLVELINRDYADFINISTSLVGLDRIIEDIADPLGAVQRDVESVREKVQSVLSELEGKLDARAELRNKKAVLQLLLSIQESLQKLEELLRISSEFGHHAEDSNIIDDGKLIERVAIEYNQFQFLVSKGKGLPFVESVQWRILRIKEKLTKILANELQLAFTAVMASPENVQAVGSLIQNLRTYVLIDKVEDAGAVFRSTVVEPFLTQVSELLIGSS
ncbi:Conserved oligomeric Golgi complex subunit 2 [Cladochytrium tenue]|nr:Conserved oligomeric Golgi complex subunit 2 [Cladochytrium tenue]